MTKLKAIAAAAFIISLGAMPNAMAAADGISRLIAVTTMKSDNANDDSLQGADKQRDLVKAQKAARSAALAKMNTRARQQRDTQSPKQ